MINIAKDGEVGLVYRLDGKSYAVALTPAQHVLLQAITPTLGELRVAKKYEVEFTDKKLN